MVGLFSIYHPPLSSSRLLTLPKVSPPKGNKRKRRGPDVMTGIPLNEDEIFHEVTVTRRRNKRIQTISTPVCIPLPPASQQVDPVPHAPERDCDVYSDAEEMELLPATRTRERKGPSRSVSVRHEDPHRHLSWLLTIL